jgi:carbonyl reductase 1
MSTYSRIGVVTGANKVLSSTSVSMVRLVADVLLKGIGLAIVRQLALQYPTSPLNNGPFLIWYSACLID